MINKFKKGKIYLVEWIDMRSDSTWHSLDDTREDLNDKFDSIGRFIEEYKGFYIFEGGRWYRKNIEENDKNLFSTFSVPKGQLLKYKELKS